MLSTFGAVKLIHTHKLDKFLVSSLNYKLYPHCVRKSKNTIHMLNIAPHDPKTKVIIWFIKS